MNEAVYQNYSVLMPLYMKDNPKWFKISLLSMLNQTVRPDEIVIVCDGEITEELNEVLSFYEGKYPGLFVIKRYEINRGLGRTLYDGVKLCRNEIIVRMDADDYSVPNRCEVQLRAINQNPDLALVGSNVDEFIDSPDHIVAHVRLPETNDEILKFAKRRCPIRHPALMYKKSKVLKAGNYRDYRHAQDYNLVVHMLLNGCKMYNCPDVLVYMRVSKDFYKRRGGLIQLKLILQLKKGFYDNGFYSFSDLVISGLGNAFVCLLPNRIREHFYKKLLRR